MLVCYECTSTPSIFLETFSKIPDAGCCYVILWYFVMKESDLCDEFNFFTHFIAELNFLHQVLCVDSIKHLILVTNLNSFVSCRINSLAFCFSAGVKIQMWSIFRALFTSANLLNFSCRSGRSVHERGYNNEWWRVVLVFLPWRNVKIQPSLSNNRPEIVPRRRPSSTSLIIVELALDWLTRALFNSNNHKS